VSLPLILNDPASLSLILAAFSVAAFHTLVGIDHYLPFVVLGRARGWSLGRVAGVAVLCGVGHVMGSIALGAVGIGVGAAVGLLEVIESFRGQAAAWGLIVFGTAYMGWAMLRLRGGHTHEHPTGANLTFWSLFIVFALGPCEPLIPVLMVPAFKHDWVLVGLVAAVFSVTTIAIMTAMSILGSLGLSLLPLRTVERYSNVGAGAAIAGSGLAIQFLGI